MDYSTSFLKWVLANNKTCKEIHEFWRKYDNDSEDPHKCFVVGQNGIQYVVCKICGNYKNTTVKLMSLPTVIKCNDPNHHLEEQMLDYKKKMQDASSRINALLMTTDRTTTFWDSSQLKIELDEMHRLLESWSSNIEWLKQQDQSGKQQDQEEQYDVFSESYEEYDDDDEYAIGMDVFFGNKQLTDEQLEQFGCISCNTKFRIYGRDICEYCAK